MQFLKKLLGLECYISGLDQFLAELAEKFPKPSASQRQEIEKYKRIYKLRDSVNHKPTYKKLWENF